MTFNEYLIQEKISVARFCKALKLSQATVANWKYNDVIPSREAVLKIYEFTNGKVTPNDFYGINK